MIRELASNKIKKKIIAEVHICGHYKSIAGASLEPDVARVIELKVYEDGSGYLLFSNNTRLSFYHNFLDPGYL
jgi:hypothetical protein